MTEAYLIEHGEITEPLREGNLIGNGPKVLRDIDAARQRLRDGQPGNMRQGWPGRARRRRSADPAGQGDDGRWDGGMRHRAWTAELSRSPSRVVARRSAGEQVEAYVSRDRETDDPRLRGRGRAVRRCPDARASASASSATAAPVSRTPERSSRSHQRRARRSAGQRRSSAHPTVGRPGGARWRRRATAASCGARTWRHTRRTPRSSSTKELERLTWRPTGGSESTTRTTATCRRSGGGHRPAFA